MKPDNEPSDLDKYGPWIETRLDPDTQPKYKLLGRQLHLDSEPTLTIHAAGQDVVWTLPIRKAATDKSLLENMDENDRNLVKWIFENDFDVDKYHYESSRDKP